MLLGGDEFRRTQGGNNNAYCQDNETSWYDWNCLNHHQEIFDFTRKLIAFRQAHPVLSGEQFYTDADIQWYAPQGGKPNWNNPWDRQLACFIQEDKEHALFLMFNASTNDGDFRLPPAPAGRRWTAFVDTFGPAAFLNDQQGYHLNPRSGAILTA